ncbi:MAG: SUMF1/EgtB/PvdO family nonheme iron enzyme [Chloroflexota bacterium]
MPIIVNLREYDGTSLLNWVRLKLLESGEPLLRDALQSTVSIEIFLQDTPLPFYLLLDGLNEVLPEYGKVVVNEIRQLSLLYPTHSIVVTSRVQDEGWRELREGSFAAETVVIQPIAEAQIRQYLIAHLEAQDANALWDRLDTRMRGLAATPLLLWLIKEAWLETQGRVPGNRGELYISFINRMLRRDDDRKISKPTAKYKRLQALTALATMMHQAKAVSWSRQQVETVIDEPHILEALLTNGLLQGEDIIRFAPHQTVQEHFAARAIKTVVEQQINEPPPSCFKQLWSQPEPTILDQTANDPWWVETFIQLAGMTDDPNTLAQKIAEANPWLAWWCVQEGRDVEPKTERIIQEKSELLVDSDDVRDRQNAVQALLKLPIERVIKHLAKLALDMDESVAESARQKLVELGKPGQQAIIRAVKSLTNRDPLKKRAAAYRTLGHPTIDADRRPGIYIIERNGISLPDIDWVSIPDDGPWIYQSDQHSGLPAFQISRYPITYAQFQTFIDDGVGFNDPRWWQGLAEDQRRNGAGDQAFQYWNHPRERVSWYDAMAFCRWLSWRLGGGYDIDNIASWSVRLPTEMEWEKAARGTDGREYPYGNTFDQTKGNTNATGIGRTSAVGLFPEGASPYGVEEMSGNVWEWCLTNYHNPAPTAKKENISSGTLRVLRGGSWHNDRDDARASYRFRYAPGLRHYADGFRLVLPPSLETLNTDGPVR